MGDFVRCIFSFSHGVLEPVMVEALVVRVVLWWLRSWHADGAVLEIDNQRLWYVLPHGKTDSSDSGIIT